MDTTNILFFAFGLLVGALLAVVISGFYLGERIRRGARRLNQLQTQYERQIDALQGDVRRLAGWARKAGRLRGEVERLQEENELLGTAVRERDTAATNAELDLQVAQSNLARLGAQIEAMEVEQQRLRARLETAEARAAEYKAQLEETIAQFSEAARLRASIIFATRKLRDLQARNRELEAQLAGQKGSSGGTTSEALDLETIPGLAPQYARRLHDSGIHTLSDLATETPERVAGFAGLESWQREESAAWIAEAKKLLDAAGRAEA